MKRKPSNYETANIALEYCRGVRRIIERGVTLVSTRAKRARNFRPRPFLVNHAHIYGRDRDLDLEYGR